MSWKTHANGKDSSLPKEVFGSMHAHAGYATFPPSSAVLDLMLHPRHHSHRLPQELELTRRGAVFTVENGQKQKAHFLVILASRFFFDVFWACTGI